MSPYVKDNATGVVWVLTNKQIEAGAKAIAEDMMLPGGGRKKLSRVVSGHLDWFDAVEARGLTWNDMTRLLFVAGAKGRGGRPISIGTLSSVVWRKRKAAHAARNGPRTPTKGRVAEEQSSAGGQIDDRNAAPGAVSKNRSAADHSSQTRGKRRTVAEPMLPTMRNVAKPKARAVPRSEAAPLASKAQTLAFMKRAATIRRGSTE